MVCRVLPHYINAQQLAFRLRADRSLSSSSLQVQSLARLLALHVCVCSVDDIMLGKSNISHHNFVSDCIHVCDSYNAIPPFSLILLSLKPCDELSICTATTIVILLQLAPVHITGSWSLCHGITAAEPGCCRCICGWSST